jgi:hypothetical protein
LPNGIRVAELQAEKRVAKNRKIYKNRKKFVECGEGLFEKGIETDGGRGERDGGINKRCVSNSAAVRLRKQ